MALNINKDAVYRAAKPKEKDYTINDGGGLFLLVKPNGSKSWQFVFTYQGRRKKLVIGLYPNAITLELARQKAAEVRAQIAKGIDPSDAKKQAKQSTQVDNDNAQGKADGLPILNSFKHVALDWLSSIEHLTAATTHTKKTSRLERLTLPVLGDGLSSAVLLPF
jgi:hypothetical protein